MEIIPGPQRVSRARGRRGCAVAKPRDYQAEYARRIERAMARGLSRSQARGHPRIGEAAASPRHPSASQPAAARRLEHALQLMFRPQHAMSVAAAARTIGIAPERLRRALAESRFAGKRGGRWVIAQDQVDRDALIYTKGRARVITVRGPAPASLIGRYMNAVRTFLTTNNVAVLAPFRDSVVMDRRRRRYLLETRPNTLYQIANSGSPSFEQIYRIVQ